MDERLDEDDIIKVEMQDVYPAVRPPGEHASQDHHLSPSRNANNGNHYDQVNNMVDPCGISVEQRAAAIMDRIKQLYYIDDDPERKEFLDDYFEFMRKRDATVTRIPTMAKQPLDLFKLYKTVVALGGLTEVVRNRHWSKVTRELSLPSSITSAAFTLRTQYLRFLYAYECFQKGIDEQPWKLDDCDDLSNGSFRATQASPASFVENRSCISSRDMHHEQHHSPQWTQGQQVICSTYGPRSLYSHSQAHISLSEGGLHAQSFPHSVDMHCPDTAHPASKMPHLTNGHALEARGRIESGCSRFPSDCDCKGGGDGYQSPVNSKQSNSKRPDDKRSSSSQSSPNNRDSRSNKSDDHKIPNTEIPKTLQNDSPNTSFLPGTPQGHQAKITSQKVGPNAGQFSTESITEIAQECKMQTGEANTNGKIDHQNMHDFHIPDHLGRIPLPLNTNAIPKNLLQYPRNAYCGQRKRPRLYNSNEPPYGGCGCGRGEMLETSEPMTFKIHYRTEQRAFVTLQFGKRMYLGELFAEQIE